MLRVRVRPTLAATVTIGIPTFFLALAPSSGPWRSARFARDVARFAIPAGTLIGVGVPASYLFALGVVRLSLLEARTVATTVLVGLGLYLILVLEAGGRRRRTIVSIGVATLAAVYVLALLVPVTREFFQVARPSAGMATMALGGGALSVVALYFSGYTPGAAATLDEPGGA